MVTLMGRNGMGKTTTVRSIMGLTPARAGSIRFAGAEIRGWPPYKVAQARHRSGAGRPADFPESERARKSAGDGGASDGSEWTLDNVYRAVPAARRARRQHG